MEAERRDSSSTARRTPLSNLTNTPIPDRSSTKPRVSKPYNSSLKSNIKQVHLNPSKSDSSIGSSNNNNNVQNPSILRAPQSLLSTPPPLKPQSRSSSSILDNRDGAEPLVIYSRKQTTQKTKKSQGEDAAVPFTDPGLAKTRGKEKEVSMALSCTPVEKTKDKGKGIFVPSGTLSSAKTKDKGKGIFVPSGTLSSVKTNFRNLEKNEERGAMVFSVSKSCPSQRITRKNRDQFVEAVDNLQPKLHTDPRPNKKKRLRASREDDVQNFALPQDFIEQQRAYFKEVDDFELLEEEVSNEEEEEKLDLHK